MATFCNSLPAAADVTAVGSIWKGVVVEVRRFCCGLFQHPPPVAVTPKIGSALPAGNEDKGPAALRVLCRIGRYKDLNLEHQDCQSTAKNLAACSDLKLSP